MIFSHSKLPSTAAGTMRVCPIESMSPYALMLAPVYIFLPRNEKYVAVKAPLDFFVPEELERLRSSGSLFVPACVDIALPFRTAARRVHALLSWNPQVLKKSSATEDTVFPAVTLPPAPYELSDAVLRLIGPLWSEGLVIEPFFTTVFANELCELLPGELLRDARDRDVVIFEEAVLRSSWAVFLALHLGNCDMRFLNNLRRRVFTEMIFGKESESRRNEVDELIALSKSSLLNVDTRHIDAKVFGDRSERIAQKILARLERVKAKMIQPGLTAPTIYGPMGFIDV